jgi:hypothetical protein
MSSRQKIFCSLLVAGVAVCAIAAPLVNASPAAAQTVLYRSNSAPHSSPMARGNATDIGETCGFPPMWRSTGDPIQSGIGCIRKTTGGTGYLMARKPAGAW